MGDTSCCTGALVLTCDRIVWRQCPCEVGESGDFHVWAAKFEYGVPLTSALAMFQCLLLECYANLGGLTGDPAHLLSLSSLSSCKSSPRFQHDHLTGGSRDSKSNAQIATPSQIR